MRRKIYLIHPKRPYADQYGADLILNAVAIADAALTTVAALAPADKFEFKICEEQVESVDYDYPADYVGITGKYGQGPRMLEIARCFRQRGVPVIMGGPYATLAPEEVRADCDVLVKGEFEGIADEFFDDLYRGAYKDEYVGPRGAIQQSPVPRWDLYPNERALCGTLQTSRGCPFECEFCDVIVYLGRKQTHKTVSQVLAELEVLYRAGYRKVILADDNLTVYRARARELLRALGAWNAAVDEPVSFATQVSIDIATDDEMLELMAAASLRSVFVGIETPNQDALKETKKRQNVGVDMAERCERFVRHGIMVAAGIIVGFDSDTTDIFPQVVDFAMRTPVPNFNVSPLNAMHGTPLRARMEREGRLYQDVRTDTFARNIVPARMSIEQLAAGVHWLTASLLEPERFLQRVLRMIELFPVENVAKRRTVRRAVVVDAMLSCHRLLRSRPDTAAAFQRILEAARHKPLAREAALEACFQWAQRMQILRDYEALPPALVGAPLTPPRAAREAVMGRVALPVLR